jgi:hypothetical protein
VNIFSIGLGVAFAVGLVLGFVLSIRLLIVPPDDNGWFHIDMETLGERCGGGVVMLVYTMIALSAFMLVLDTPVVAGQLAREEMSPFPWDEFLTLKQRDWSLGCNS